jgi:hypothetical protein
MDDAAFDALKLKMTIVPGQTGWPPPEYLHWRYLHECTDEARASVSKAYAKMAAIDADPDLSPQGKQRRRREAAAQALAELEASSTLKRARDTV